MKTADQNLLYQTGGWKDRKKKQRLEEMEMKRIGFIGMGNMGYAILKGLLQVFDREVLLLTDADRKRAEKISEETGVACAADNAACASMADYVVLAVKPQYYDAVLSDIKDTVTKEKIII